MDKDIEDLLRMLQISTEFAHDEAKVLRPEPPVCEKKLKLSQCESTPRQVIMAKEQRGVSLFSLCLIVTVSSLVGILCSFGYFTYMKGRETQPLRIVETPLCQEVSFLQAEKKKPVSPLFTCVALNTPKDFSESCVLPAPSFFMQPSATSQPLFSRLMEAESALFNKKGPLLSCVRHQGPLIEREELRSFAKSSEQYVRFLLTQSASLEGDVSNLFPKQSLSEHPELLFVSRFGGVPSCGCQEVVSTSQKVKKQCGTLFSTFQEAKTYQEKAEVAGKLLSLLEKVSTDHLLRLLVDVKEEKKRWEDRIEKTLKDVSFTSENLTDIKTVRALSSLETFLKKDVIDWGAAETLLSYKVQNFSFEQYNALSSKRGPITSQREVWTSISFH